MKEKEGVELRNYVSSILFSLCISELENPRARFEVLELHGVNCSGRVLSWREMLIVLCTL